jgi:hypothetical protein
VSEHRRCRSESPLIPICPTTARRPRALIFRGTFLRIQNCDPNSRTSLWRSTDPQRSDTSPNPRPAATNEQRRTRPTHPKLNGPHDHHRPSAPPNTQ